MNCKIAGKLTVAFLKQQSSKNAPHDRGRCRIGYSTVMFKDGILRPRMRGSERLDSVERLGYSDLTRRIASGNIKRCRNKTYR